MKAYIKDGVLHIEPQSKEEAKQLDEWVDDAQHALSYQLQEWLAIETEYSKKKK